MAALQYGRLVTEDRSFKATLQGPTATESCKNQTIGRKNKRQIAARPVVSARWRQQRLPARRHLHLLPTTPAPLLLPVRVWTVTWRPNRPCTALVL